MIVLKRHKRSSRRLGRGPQMVQQVDRDDGAGTALVDVYNIDCRVALRHLRGTRDVSPQRREQDLVEAPVCHEADVPRARRHTRTSSGGGEGRQRSQLSQPLQRARRNLLRRLAAAWQAHARAARLPLGQPRLILLAARRAAAQLLSLERAKVHLVEARVDQPPRSRVQRGDRVRRRRRSSERRRCHQADRDVGQDRRERRRLTAAVWVQRNVRHALNAPGDVPVRLAMATEVQAARAGRQFRHREPVRVAVAAAPPRAAGRRRELGCSRTREKALRQGEDGQRAG
mmetsp:Transcript_27161/g.84989  ORF Transcript_27161/g.84989 Transcript_27161/m.84989 type:complete len:286 (-) Transcript_27161:39-896(-)